MTGNSQPIDLFRLLPSVYQVDDERSGGALRALLGVLSEQAERVRADIAGLWDDFFVETAAEWALPYLGELVGNTPLHPATGRRADIAKAIYYRRRKGTLPVLEELARDVTGWGAAAVAFFELLGWTQNVNHVRVTDAPNPLAKNPPAADRVGTVNLRSRDALDRSGGAFGTLARTVDVRLPNARNGWYNVPNVGFFLWRLGSYAVARGDARPAAGFATGYHVNPLGLDAPLFTVPAPERDETGRATELHVPGPVRPLAFCADVADYRRLYATTPPADPPPSLFCGPGKSLALYPGGAARPLSALTVCPADLRVWAAPPPGQVAVDVARGRVAFNPADAPAAGLRVSYAYGFAGDIGGGPYDRRRRTAAGEPPPDRPDYVRDPNAIRDTAGAPLRADVTRGTAVSTLQAGVNGLTGSGVVQVGDSRTYTENLSVTVTDREVVVQAANRHRPVLLGDITVTGAGRSRLRLDGLWIAGSVTVTGDLQFLELAHCTLVPGVALAPDGTPQQPGRPSLTVTTTATQTARRLQVSLDRCVTGPLQLPATAVLLAARDCVIQSVGALPAVGGAGGTVGPLAVFERCTVLGAVAVRELTLASDSIFTGRVTAERRQTGCVRFSHVPTGSQTPRRYRCQPDMALEEVTDPAERDRIRLRVAPRFVAVRYGAPGYAQLAADGPDEVRTGAASGSEMGAFEHLMNPHREANLRARLDEYLPAGLTAGLIFVT